MLRLVWILLTRLIVAGLLGEGGLRAIRRGSTGWVVLGVVLEVIALFALAMAALAGVALFERVRRPAA